MNDIDSSLLQLYTFSDGSAIQNLLMGDALFEFHTMFLYEEANKKLLETVVKINQQKLNPIQMTELEMNVLIEKKFYFENPVLQINRIYLGSDKLQKLKDNMSGLKQQLSLKSSDNYFVDHFEKKSILRNCLCDKYKENMRNLRIEYENINIDTMKFLLIDKNLRK